ncbi:hypothetical protein F5J12DRAFT_724865 [Pisolithus orientalis]|uniref:uncharacterized protein n=1 Tax=Pisolithus orientalis TaxID=936130 RepID=UPI002225AE56|nr:uncharacterized protein F5J12DRAFT_724865 [Pisolithus orientalis]KAI5998397.1 hypothetical protein F5J12DRAFT_724865 [Pisolithus orientalis]
MTLLWLGSVPSNFGDVSVGTIKADEWPSLIMVYLSPVLINLWGTSNDCSNDGADLKAILDHTMDLVSAINLACTQIMSTLQASAYHANISSYVGKPKALYPTFDAQPNHHTLFHIYDYLLLFGSMQLWC